MNFAGSKSSEEPIQQETALPKPGLGAALAAHAETQTQAYKATAKGQTPSECKDREAVKAAILAQYGASVVEESEEEESDEGRISEWMSCEESAIFSQILQIILILDKITQPV